MTESYGLFDAADPEAPDRVYTSEAFARLFRTIMRDGIVHNDGDELAVSPSVPAAMSVSVGTGMALIQGRYYINDSDLTLNVEAADPSHPRIDRVVVRLEATPGRTVHAVVKKGTPAPSPVPPGLTRTAETWELSLAQVRVEAGATSILSAKITDERANTSLCGVAAPVYVPSSQLEVVGPVDMQGKALTGLPVPSAATDAARRNMGGATLQGLGTPSATTDAATKAYVDGKVAGFGISQIAIDADKNWNGKTISNVHIGAGASCLLVRAYPSATLRTSSDALRTVGGKSDVMVKLKEIVLSANLRGENTFIVEYEFGRVYTSASFSGDCQLYVNGVPRGTLHEAVYDYTKFTEEITGLHAGDAIQVYGRSNGDVTSYTMGARNFRLYADYAACPTPIIPTNTVNR